MSGLAIAVGFMTRLPLGQRRRLGEAELTRAAVWFPAVGLLVGAVVGGTRALAHLVLGAGPATVLALLAAVMLTGALHEDGLADAADAIGAHVTRDRRREILHDPRVGTYGALALTFSTLLALTVLAPLDDEHVLRAALAGHVLGRWSTLPLALTLAPAASGGSGALVRPSRAAVLGATGPTFAVAVLVGGVAAGAATVAATALVTALCAVTAHRVLGGASGDVFGAATKLVELACYLVLAAAWR